MRMLGIRAWVFRASVLRGALLAAVAGLACGCAALGAPTQKGYTEVLQTWVGEPTSDLIARWGAPGDRYLGPNGGVILQYTRITGNSSNIDTHQQPTSQVQASGSPNASAEAFRTLGAQSGMAVQTTETCVTRFTADSGGIIRQFESAGDACRAEEPQDRHWGQSAQPLLSPRAAAGSSAG